MRALLVILLLGCGCGGVPLTTVHPGYAELSRTVVHVESPLGLSCAGVVLEEGILTAAHCVPALPGAEVSLEDGDPEPAVVLRRDEGADLALLSRPGSWTREAVLGFQPGVGGEVVACGHPAGVDFVCHHGYVSGALRHEYPGVARLGWYTIDVGAVPGMSGGPVFDSSGQVVGITSFFVGDTHVGGIIDPATIRHFLHP